MSKLMSKVWVMLKQKLRGSYGRLKSSREEVKAGVENQELTQKYFLTPILSHIYMDTPDCLHKLKFGFGTIISEVLGVSWILEGLLMLPISYYCLY